ncbi:BtpA/SgcQ family protein [bacterium]|nr:BtpA/SgcQ family protein [bacterium]
MWTRDDLREALGSGVVGMIHLPALPGSPGWQGDLAAVETFTLAEAEALTAGGVRAIMVENYHDVPFLPGRVGAETVAAMTRLVGAVGRHFPDVALGVNVLRNDVDSALGIAVATGARFVRVNVHSGAAVTDQGPITGRAWETLRRRRELGADRPAAYVAILADVRVKHARPLVARPLAEEAADLRLRGRADAVIVTGAATGAGTDPADLVTVREALPDCPLLVGSGADAATAAMLRAHADGCIVGTSLKEPGAPARVSATRTREFLAAWQAVGA